MSAIKSMQNTPKLVPLIKPKTELKSAVIAHASMPYGVRARTIPPAPQYFTFNGWNIDETTMYVMIKRVQRNIAKYA